MAENEEKFPWLSTFTTDDVLIEEDEEEEFEPPIRPMIGGFSVGGASAFTAKELEERKGNG